MAAAATPSPAPAAAADGGGGSWSSGADNGGSRVKRKWSGSAGWSALAPTGSSSHSSTDRSHSHGINCPDQWAGSAASGSPFSLPQFRVQDYFDGLQQRDLCLHHNHQQLQHQHQQQQQQQQQEQQLQQQQDLQLHGEQWDAADDRGKRKLWQQGPEAAQLIRERTLERLRIGARAAFSNPPSVATANSQPHYQAAARSCSGNRHDSTCTTSSSASFMADCTMCAGGSHRQRGSTVQRNKGLNVAPLPAMCRVAGAAVGGAADTAMHMADEHDGDDGDSERPAAGAADDNPMCSWRHRSTAGASVDNSTGDGGRGYSGGLSSGSSSSRGLLQWLRPCATVGHGGASRGVGTSPHNSLVGDGSGVGVSTHDAFRCCGVCSRPSTGQPHSHILAGPDPMMSAQLLLCTCSHCSRPACHECCRACHSCGQPFCSFCSVVNYDDARCDRAFCLDCVSRHF